MTEKFMPVGIQDFEKMITGNFLYVDKTRYLYEMARPLQGFYFLARPRRFGKSLMVSTFYNLFKGKKNLFKDLYISKTDWEWKDHPVLKVDFTQMNSDSPEKLEASLFNYIFELSEKHGIRHSIRSLPDCFVRLITRLSAKFNESVVILIDEYDKPIIDHLGRGEEHLDIALKNRDKLKQFFGVLKGSDVSTALRFVFITGISKFARVSIFSDLNNLYDISMNRKYAAVVGYNEDEMNFFFDSCIDKLSKDMRLDRSTLLAEIENWYNGYRFTQSLERVCNPFSILNFFKTGEFDNYWFATGTPSFLINLIKEKKYPVTDIESLILPKELFTTYELESLQLEPLLFQTGYLTIKDYKNDLYYMNYPNKEVKKSFLTWLLNDFTRLKNGRLAGMYKFLPLHLNAEKIEDFISIVQSVLASIPYAQIAGQDEAYYHTVFYLMLSASGADVHSEVLTNQGRIDIAVEFDDKVYVIELKCNQSSKKAIAQIIKKKYYEKYLGSIRKIYLMGINFDTEKRGINDWKCGELGEFLDGKA